MTISAISSNLLANIRYRIGLGEHPRMDEWRVVGRAVIEAALALPDMDTAVASRPKSASIRRLGARPADRSFPQRPLMAS